MSTVDCYASGNVSTVSQIHWLAGVSNPETGAVIGYGPAWPGAAAAAAGS